MHYHTGEIILVGDEVFLWDDYRAVVVKTNMDGSGHPEYINEDINDMGSDAVLFLAEDGQLFCYDVNDDEHLVLINRTNT